MTTSTTATETMATETTGAGRPREFDEDEVLDALVQLFWTKGYESASLADIVDAAGLNKSSIYNAFGSKQELFYRALDRYLDQRSAAMEQCVADGGLDSIFALFDMIRTELTQATPGRGCLVVNATTELGLREEQARQVSHRYRAVMRDTFEAALRQAAADHVIDGGLVDVYADSLVGLAVSLSVASRGGVTADELARMVDSTQTLVNSWRLS